MPIIDVIEACVSLDSYHLSVHAGDYLQPTVSLFTAPGDVALIHVDPAIVEQDYLTLKNAMEDGFVVEETGKAGYRG